MRPTVLHHPKVSWDAARALVTAASAGLDTYAWCRDRTGQVLGTACRLELHETRRRMLDEARRDDQRGLEIVRWRARIADALDSDSDLAEDVHLLTMHTASKLGGGYWRASY